MISKEELSEDGTTKVEVGLAIKNRNKYGKTQTFTRNNNRYCR